MAINSVIRHTRDLTRPLTVTALPHALVSGDDRGDAFEIAVTRSGEAVSLSGASVQGYFVRSGDGSTIPVSGSASGNTASVTLPQACYAAPGRFTLTVKATVGNVRHALYVCEGTVLRSATDALIDPGHTIPSLEELLAKIDLMDQATAAANTATGSATAAAQQANAARDSASKAAEGANAARQNADEAAGKAGSAAGAADASAAGANEAASRAEEAARGVKDAIDKAEEAAANADSRAREVRGAAELAQGAAEAAIGAAQDAAGAAAQAEGAAGEALEAARIAGRWGNVTATVTMLGAEEAASVTLTDAEGGKELSFRLPRGLTGLTPNMTIGEVLTGEPGSEARAWLTGTGEEPVLNLSVPQGETGAIDHLTVCGAAADGSGNIALTAQDVGAMPADAKVIRTVNGEGPDETGDVKVNTGGPLDAYPVGAVYLSLEAASPAALFGGDWAQISGYYLYMGASPGATGGASSVTSGGSSAANTGGTALTTGGSGAANSGGSSAANTGSTALTEAQMPKHLHQIDSGRFRSSGGTAVTGKYNLARYGEDANAATNDFKISTLETGSGAGHTHTMAHTHTIAHTHSIASHTHSMAHTHTVSTMPPYYQVYAWRRVA